MGGIQYGYIRVSTKEQNINRQWDALKQYGISEKNIFIDKQSGKDFNRPCYQQLMEKLHEGDCLVVVSLDRLGRNYWEIQEQWRIITKVFKADVVVLNMSLLDTRQVDGNLMGAFVVADMVLQILSYVADTERTSIRQRQAEGIASAQARGVQFGRREISLTQEFYDLVKQWREGDMTGREVAQRLKVSRSWLYRKVRKLNI